MLLLIAAFPVRKIEDYETVPYSFVPAFFLTAPTFYYYVMLIVPLFLFAPKIARFPRAVGLAGIFGFSFIAYVLYHDLPLEFKLCFLLSCLLQALVLCMMAVSFWAREPAAAPAVTPGSTPETPPFQTKPPGKRKSKSKRRSAPGTPCRKVSRVPPTAPTAKAGATGGHLAARCPQGWFSRNLWALGILLVLVGGVLVWAGFRFRSSLLSMAPSTRDVELVFVGDVMLSRNVAASIQRHNNDYTFPFQKTVQYTREADVAFCNLECPVTERGDLVSKNYQFRATPASLAGLTYAGFRLVSVANNHVLDYGPIGLDDTLQALARSHINYVGICLEDAPQVPVVFNVKGMRIGYLAYADPKPTFAYAKEFLNFPTRPAKGEKEIIQADIARLKPQVDLVVVSIHWGTEYQTESDDWQRELGRFIIDAGAAIVAGHHPHVQQDPELYNGGLIIYSMGNFVFDQHTRPPTRLSRLYRVYVSKSGLIRAEYLPLEITNLDWQPTPTAPGFVPVAASCALPPAEDTS